MAPSTRKLADFLGINERLSRASLRTQDGLFVAGAKNVDVQLPGTLVGRQGYSKVVGGKNMRCLWATPDGRAYVVSDNQLCALDVQHKKTRPLGLDIAATASLSYELLADNSVAVSDAQSLFRIKADGSVCKLTTPPPSPEPTVKTGVDESRYLYCFAYADELGTVGLCTQPRIAVGTPEFEVPPPPPGLCTQIYVSQRNGEVMYLLGQSWGGAVRCGEQRIGGECLTLSKQGLPAGEILALHGGRLYSVRGSTIYYSDAFNYGVMSAGNFIQMPARVSILATVPNGMFIVCDKTYWLRGTDPTKAELNVVNEHKGIRRSLCRLADGRPVWAGSNGVVVGALDGNVQALTDAYVPGVSIGSGDVGATVPTQRNGANQIISKRRHSGYGRVGVTMTAE